MLPPFRWEKQEDLRLGQRVRLPRTPIDVSSCPTAKIIGLERRWVTLRGWNRSIFRMNGDGLHIVLSDLPDDDPNAPFEIRRNRRSPSPTRTSGTPCERPGHPSKRMAASSDLERNRISA